VARVNYQREKRLKDLDRQKKQEEKRTRKLQKDLDPATAPETDTQDAGTSDIPVETANPE